MSSLLEHCHGGKTHFSGNERRTFSLSRTNNVELAQALSWRENALFEEWEKNVFVKPNEQCRACSNIVMASKRTFRGTRKNSKTHQPTNSSTQKLKIFVFILQRCVIFHSVLAKIRVKKQVKHYFFLLFTSPNVSVFKKKPAFCTLLPFQNGCQLIIFQAQFPAFRP